MTKARDSEFIVWREPNNTVGGIGSYITEVNDSECGVCSNIGNVTGNELSCYNWTASGQVCNVLVWSVSADCGFESEEPAIFKIHLQSRFPIIISNYNSSQCV